MASARRRGDRIAAKARKRSQPDPTLALLNAQTRLRFGPAEDQLKRLLGQLDAHGGTIDRAFEGYKAELGQAAERQRQAYADAAGRMQATATGVAGATAQLGKNNQADLEAAAKRYGMPAPDTHLLDQAGDLAAVNGAYARAGQGALEGAGLAGQNALARHLGNLPAERMAAQDKLGGLKNDANAKLLELLGQEGAFKIDQLNTMRSQEDQADIARQTLGLKSKKMNLDAELKKLGIIQDSKEFAAKQKLSRDELKAKIDHWTEQERIARTKAAKGGSGGSGGADLPGQRHDARGGLLSKAQSERWYQLKDKLLAGKRAFISMASSGRYKNTAEISVALRKAGYSHAEINMARDLAFAPGGRLSKANIAAAKAYFPGGLPPLGFLPASRGK